MGKNKLTSEKIYKSAQILNLGEKATMAQIKDNYKKLIKKWHPDNCTQDKKVCKQKTEEIVKAYNIIVEYCKNYLFSFAQDEILNNMPVEFQMKEKWKQQFMNDPLWN